MSKAEAKGSFWPAMMSSFLLFIALILWGQAGWVYLKAQLAQVLIAKAWHQQLEGEMSKPWPWADTWPVARLQIPNLGIDQIVLNGAQGNALAFGPGYSQESQLPGQGTTVFSGHRDTHFKFLKSLEYGDRIRVQTDRGEWLQYEVFDRRVVNSGKQPLQIDVADDQLILITCYPFFAVTQGPLRYRVTAKRILAGANKVSGISPAIMSNRTLIF